MHSSGVHGPEGYLGSAIQRDWIANFTIRSRSIPKGHLAIFVHAVNPFGMAWWHRFNENNVDLNRNAIVHPGRCTVCNSNEADFLRHVFAGTAQGDTARFAELQAHPNDDYVAFNPLINPADVGFMDCFLLKAGAMIAWYGMGRMKQAAVGGQYSFPTGMYFGGFELQESISAVLTVLLDLGVTRSNPKLRTLVHVDVHSGLGPSGVDTLLLDGGQPLQLIRRIAGVEGEDRVPGVPFESLRVQGSTADGLSYDTVGSFTSAVMLLAGTQHPTLLPQLVDTPPNTSGWEDLVASRQAAATAAASQGASGGSRSRSAGRARGAARKAKQQSASAEAHPVVKLAITQEFGTLEPLEVFKAVRALNCRLASQPELPMDAPERAGSLGAFYVDTPEWKLSTLTRGRDILSKFWDAAMADQDVLLAEVV